jgi:hypothetical protein
LSNVKLKKLTLNLALMAVSTAVALFLCELAARLVLDPVDFLSPTLVRDDTLGIRLPPGSSGHDDWGFRNPRVPESVDIVALGDSHTYGNCARMAEAWPAQVARITGRSVYNLGMGGYGPNQYLHLLRTKAFTLKPKFVVCGLYFGDDFDNAFRITYGLESWKTLRKADVGVVEADIWEQESDHPSFQKRVRNWLSSHSILYRVVVHGLLSGVKGAVQIRNAAEMFPGAHTLLVPEKNIEEAFRPDGVYRGVKQDKKSVREGMRVTFEIFAEMDRLCRSNNAQLVVALIPTKETVFAPHFEGRPAAEQGNIPDLIANEEQARTALLGFLAQSGITFVDALPALRQASTAEKLYTPSAADMHPGKNGYRVIAEAVARDLPADRR